jgi:hypothetical protein
MSTPNPQAVRRADPDDLASLIASASLIFADGALQPVSGTKVAALVQRCIERDRAIAGIIDGTDGIEASIGMAVESFAYSDLDHLAVMWLGVHTPFRKTTHAQQLLAFAVWAQSVMEVPLFADLSTLDSQAGRLHLYLRTMPQIGARFSCGSDVAGAFSQRELGHDPHGERVRSRAKFAVRPAA